MKSKTNAERYPVDPLYVQTKVPFVFIKSTKNKPTVSESLIDSSEITKPKESIINNSNTDAIYELNNSVYKTSSLKTKTYVNVKPLIKQTPKNHCSKLKMIEKLSNKYDENIMIISSIRNRNINTK